MKIDLKKVGTKVNVLIDGEIVNRNLLAPEKGGYFVSILEEAIELHDVRLLRKLSFKGSKSKIKTFIRNQSKNKNAAIVESKNEEAKITQQKIIDKAAKAQNKALEFARNQLIREIVIEVLTKVKKAGIKVRIPEPLKLPKPKQTPKLEVVKEEKKK